MPADEFLDTLLGMRTLQTSEAAIDNDRKRRCGYPEVIYGEGKTSEIICEILQAQQAAGIGSFVTRICEKTARTVQAKFPRVLYNASARTLRLPLAEKSEHQKLTGRVAIISAGTSDLPVAEEAYETLAWMGVSCQRILDVGVAGPHRLVERLDDFARCDAIVVVAGMEGALPSVVGGYVDCPVIAVPTSVGYGASFGGVAALLGMLNSCASNVTVVNIDAGFKGAYVAGMIAQRANVSRN